MPKVSICIPTYNQVIFLRKTLESIKVQTFKDFEVIVTDDSTNDDVQNLITEFSSFFKIHYFRNVRSLGSPANWNEALSKANSPIIKFMHHDDWFKDANSLEKFVVALESKGEISFAFSATEINNQQTGKIAFSHADPRFLEKMKTDARSLFAKNLIGAPSATIFRRNGLLFDESVKYLVDIDFYIRYLKENEFIYIDAPLIVNVSGHSGQVTAASQDKVTQLGEYSYIYDKFFKNELPDLQKSWFFIRLFRSYKVRSLDEIVKTRNIHLQPVWYFRLLIAISSIRNRRK